MDLIPPAVVELLRSHGDLLSDLKIEQMSRTLYEGDSGKTEDGRSRFRATVSLGIPNSEPELTYTDFVGRTARRVTLGEGETAILSIRGEWTPERIASVLAYLKSLEPGT